MKPVMVRYEEDPASEQIEVIVRAPKKTPEVEALLSKVSGAFERWVTVSDQTGVLRTIHVSDIVSASVVGRQVNVKTGSGTYHLKQTLQSLEKDLNDPLFLRISRFELINMRKVVRYDFRSGGTLHIELEGGNTAWASRRSIPLIRKRLCMGTV